MTSPNQTPISLAGLNDRFLGASYAAALLNDDNDMVEAYWDAFGANRLLTAVGHALRDLAAGDADLTPGQIGDCLVADARAHLFAVA